MSLHGVIRHRAVRLLVAALALAGFLLLNEKDSNRFLAFLGLVAIVREWLKEEADSGPTWKVIP